MYENVPDFVILPTAQATTTLIDAIRRLPLDLIEIDEVLGMIISAATVARDVRYNIQFEIARWLANEYPKALSRSEVAFSRQLIVFSEALITAIYEAGARINGMLPYRFAGLMPTNDIILGSDKLYKEELANAARNHFAFAGSYIQIPQCWRPTSLHPLRS